MARKVPDRLLHHAAELIRAGSSLRDAASTIGFTADVVSLNLRDIGFKIPLGRPNGSSGPIPKSISNITQDVQIAIAKGYILGRGTPALATEFGISRGSVEKILKRQRVTTRTSTEANRLMASVRTPEEKAENTKKARLARAGYLAEDAACGLTNPSIGFGETEFAGILRERSIEFQQQVRIDEYILDFVIRNVAVEVKTSSVSAHLSQKKARARFKKIVESNYRFIYLVINDGDVLRRYASHVIAGINRASREPTSIGQYWVIECRLEQIGAHTEVDRFSIEKRTPKTLDLN